MRRGKKIRPVGARSIINSRKVFPLEENLTLKVGNILHYVHQDQKLKKIKNKKTTPISLSRICLADTTVRNNCPKMTVNSTLNF